MKTKVMWKRADNGRIPTRAFKRAHPEIVYKTHVPVGKRKKSR